MSQWKRQSLFAVLVILGFGLVACHGGGSNATSPNATSSSGSSPGGSSSSGTVSGLIPLVTGDLKLELLDPSQAIGSSNPVIADTGLPNQFPSTSCSSQGCLQEDRAQAIVFQTGTINPSTGALSNLHTARVAYIKGSPGAGKLFTVDTVRGDSHAPVQVSNIANACGMSHQFGPGLTDLSNPIDSWIIVGLPGKDGTCFTRDDQFVAVKLNTPATSPGVTVAGLHSALALYNDSGAIVGFLDNVANANGTGTGEHRDANFANPTTVFTSASGEEPRVDDISTTQIYFAFVPNGQATYELHRYDVASGTLSAALYTFANGGPNLSFVANLADANNYYFTDGNKVLRISRSATATGQAVLMTTLPSGQQSSVVLLQPLTASRVVGEATAKFGADISVFSVPTDASNAAATILASSNARSSVVDHISTVDASGLVYINKLTISASGVSHNAVLIHDDGTGMSSIANAAWVGNSVNTSVANIGIGFEVSRIMVLRDTVSDPSGRFATHTLTAINASTGAPLNTLGSITNAAVTFGYGVGRYVPIGATVNHGSSAHNEVYIADSHATNSLKPVSTANGHNTYIGK